MSIFSNLKNYLTKSVFQTSYEVIPIGKGKTFNADFGGDIIYSTCIKILANNIANNKWAIYNDKNTPNNLLMKNYNFALNLQAYHGISAVDFWTYIETQRNAEGNGIAYIKFDDRGILQHLVPLDAGNIRIYWDNANILEGKRKIIYEYNDVVNGKTYTFLPEEIFHVKANSVNGIVGRRSIDVLRDTLYSNKIVENSLRESCINGFSGTIVLSYTSDLSTEKRKILQEQVKELLSNSNNTILPLPVGMSATNISNDIKGYYETLKNTNAEAISSFFGIPLAMLNIAGGAGMATFSTNQMTQFYHNTITPIIRQYANELSIKLLTQKQLQNGYIFDTALDEFDFLDAQTKASVLSAYTGAGILTSNEARASLKYEQSNDEFANILTQRGGTGRLGDSANNEGKKE